MCPFDYTTVAVSGKVMHTFYLGKNNSTVVKIINSEKDGQPYTFSNLNRIWNLRQYVFLRNIVQKE